MSTPPPDEQAQLPDQAQRPEQAQWLERSAKTLDDCRDLLSHIAEDSRDRELLQRVAEQLDGSRAALSQVVDTLGALPGMADSQRASLVCLRKHVESSHAAHQDDLAALREIKEDIAASREVTLQLNEQMQAFRKTQEGREERWAILVDEKARPFLRMGWSLVILAAASLVLSLIALWR